MLFFTRYVTKGNLMFSSSYFLTVYKSDRIAPLHDFWASKHYLLAICITNTN